MGYFGHINSFTTTTFHILCNQFEEILKTVYVKVCYN